MKQAFLSLFILFFSISVCAQKTHIYIVRHAEKDMTNPNATDPNLSAEGLLRAENLANELKRMRISGAFTTSYKRTKQTAQPTANHNNLALTTYSNINSLVNTVKNNYNGKRVLIVGHSNTVIDIITALGGQSPITSIPEEDFDNFFHLVIHNNTVRVYHKKY